MTNRRLPARAHRSLVDRPQRFGILPTRGFWNDRENWRQVRWALAGLGFATILALGFVALGWLVEGLIAAAVIVIGTGVLEKYVRRQARRRRALAEPAKRATSPR